MEKNVLIDFETFEEFPDKYLCINTNSNYYYVKIDDNTYITKRNIDSILLDDKNNIFIYISFFLIGNTLSIKDLIGIRTNIFKIIDYVNIGILISHRLVLFLLIDSKVISSSISDFIGALVLIYVIGIAISYYIKVIPIVRDII